MRAVELVGGAGEKVGAERLDVDEDVRRVVNGVDEDEGPGRVRRRGDAGHVVDRPDGIRRAADGDEARPPSEEARERVDVEFGRLRNRGERPHDDPPLPFERAPRVDVRVVVQLGDDDLVAFAPAAGERARDVEGQRRHVRAKGDLGRVAAEEVRDGGPGAGEEGVRLLARRVPPVRVRVVPEEIVRRGVGDRTGDLRSSGAVKIGHRNVPHSPLERRELRPDRLDRENAGFTGGRHGIRLSAR